MTDLVSLWPWACGGVLILAGFLGAWCLWGLSYQRKRPRRMLSARVIDAADLSDADLAAMIAELDAEQRRRGHA